MKLTVHNFLSVCINIIFVLSITHSDLQAQSKWKAVWETFSGKDTLYNIQLDNYQVDKRYYFPSWQSNDDAIIGGVKLKTPIKLTINDLSFKDRLVMMYKKLHNPTKVSIKNTIIYNYCYCQNISEYQISLHFLNDDKWYTKTFPVTNSGYQNPNGGMISDWIPTLNKNISDSICVSELIISVSKKQDAKNQEIVIGDFKMFTVKKKTVEVKHPFLEQVLGGSKGTEITKNPQLAKKQQPDENNPSLFPGTELFYSDEPHSANFNIISMQDSCTETEEKELLLKFTRACIEWYPFYDERHLDKFQLLNEFSDLEKNCSVLSLQESAKSIKKLVDRYHDGHFKLNLPEKGKSSENKPPIRLLQIKDKICVAAVFDSTLAKKIPLNSHVVSIDNVPVKTFLDTLIAKYKLPTEAAVRICLDRDEKQKAFIKYLTPDNTIDSAVIQNGKHYRIPGNFGTKNRYFKQLGQSSIIGYYQLSNFNLGDFIDFTNRLDLIQTKKGLIFDIRGNGGGESIEAMRILSLFINKPAIFSHSKNIYGDWETEVVRPNRLYKIKTPVVILIDENTACAAEIFAEAMRANASAVLIGKSHTAGYFAALNTVNFPSSLSFRIDCLYSKMYTPKQESIEAKGISPDIWVKINDVQDLYPYNDKVLQSAITYLSKYN